MIVHRLSRELHGAPGVVLPLPLCWDADTRSRGPVDDEDWFTAWDQGAIDPLSLVFSTVDPQLVPASQDADVTCPDCLEWMHA
jgi:hypothetical protein